MVVSLRRRVCGLQFRFLRYRSHCFKPDLISGALTALALSLLFTAHVSAQEFTPDLSEFYQMLETARASASVSSESERSQQEADYRASLRQRRPEPIVMYGLKGSVSVSSACPVGYARRANLEISNPEVIVAVNQGVDCEGRQCKAWTVITDATDDMTYDLSMRLQCSGDDTTRVISRQGGRNQ